MTEQEIQALVVAVLEVALLGGLLGGFAWALFESACRSMGELIGRRMDKQARIRDARWRARWNRAFRESRQAGLEGREAVAYAVNAIKADKQAALELLDA